MWAYILEIKVPILRTHFPKTICDEVINLLTFYCLISL